eukprot:1143908-Pelagomonas_calceolata.AAC.9
MMTEFSTPTFKSPTSCFALHCDVTPSIVPRPDNNDDRIFNTHLQVPYKRVVHEHHAAMPVPKHPPLQLIVLHAALPELILQGVQVQLRCQLGLPHLPPA